jgi:cell division protein FtsB
MLDAASQRPLVRETNMSSAADRDPRHHTQQMQTELQDIKDRLRQDIEKVDEPQLKVTYYHWRQVFGRLKSDHGKQLKELEAENVRLRHAISDLKLGKLILREAARASPSLYQK